MNRLFYPALFHTEEIGYSVSIPDIDGCFSEGDTMEDACENIIDALGLCIEDYTARKKEIPTASKPTTIKHADDEFVVMIEFDMLAYRKKHDTKAVKKTLTIPSWLNALAEEQHINFSSVLQTALKQQLDIEQ